MLLDVNYYLKISKQLANSHRDWHFKVFSKMISCRLLFGHNALFFLIYGFNEKRISQYSQYLTKKEMMKLQKEVNPSHYIELTGNKLSFYKRCKSNDLPTPDILAIISETNITVPHNIPVIKHKEDLYEFFAQYDNKILFLKMIDGAWGHGVLSVKIKNGNLYDPFDTKLTHEDIITHCLRHNRGYLIQEHLAPHKEVKSLMPGPALGSFRLVTILKNNNQVEIPYAFLKVPVRGNIADNFRHGETGNLLCGIDVSSGKILDARGIREGEHSLLKLKHHPDTKAEFRSLTVPFWKEILSLVAQGAKVFPEFKTLGWDIAITDQGLYIIEANCYYDPDGPQITLDRGIKTEIHQLYDK